jgi:hypothetical protein
MRKVLIAAAALMFCATPAAAQQTLARPQIDQQATLDRAAASTPVRSLYPSTAQVKADVRSNEERLGHNRAPLGSKDWWYLVAAIAIGVIIAAVVL